MNDTNTEKLNEIAERVTRIEALLTEYVRHLDTINKRLDIHSQRLDALERAKNKAEGASMSTRWLIATMLSCVSVGCVVAKLIVG